MMQMKDLSYYLGLPYTIVLKRDDEGDFVARITELQGCTAHGSTVQEAVDCLEEQKKAWIEDALEVGDPVPEPTSEESLPSGKWLQRVTRSLHAKVAEQARREGVSLNQFVATVLAETVGICSSGAVLIGEGHSGFMRLTPHGSTPYLPTHNGWAIYPDFSGPTIYIDEAAFPRPCALAHTVRLFANRVPGKLTTGLKAMQDDAAKKNIKLVDA
jgi:predicted RNase H-like HicB family nuclease